MRIAAFSDSHGFENELRFAMEQAFKLGPVDGCAFMGDGADDFYNLSGLMRRHNPNMLCWAVRGNNDYYRPGLEENLIITLNRTDVMLTHGHRYGHGSADALVKAAAARGCRAVLYGHTHWAEVRQEDNVLLMNPGSVALPRHGGPSFGLLTVGDDGACSGEIIWL